MPGGREGGRKQAREWECTNQRYVPHRKSIKSGQQHQVELNINRAILTNSIFPVSQHAEDGLLCSNPTPINFPELGEPAGARIKNGAEGVFVTDPVGEPSIPLHERQAL